MARYLITGIAGFIGSSLARALVDQGHEVSGIDNLSTGTIDNLAEIRHAISFQQMDLQDVSGIKAACGGIDYILHQGALASVPRSVKDPLTSHESNINGTLNLLIAARDAKVRRIVYAASSSAYGDQPTQPKQEDMLPRPLSPYAVQKLTCEYYIQSFYRAYGLEGVCLRYFNIFAHAVSANLLACLAPSEVATGRVFNVGTGKSHTLNEVYAAIAGQLGFTAKPHYGPPRAGDIQHSLADITRATTELGYQPKAHFHEGLRKTVAWYVEEKDKKQSA